MRINIHVGLDCLWSGKQARNQVLALVYSIAQFARQATALQAQSSDNYGCIRHPALPAEAIFPPQPVSAILTMHNMLIEQTIRPASSGKRPAGTYMINQCYLTAVIRMQAILYADVYGIVALPKIAPLHQVVHSGTSFSIFSLPSSHGLRCTERQMAL